MASEVDICNMALDRLGHLSITSLDQNSKAAQLCSRNYTRCRDAILRAHTWNFAISRAELALDGTTPNHEFTYRFALPTGPTPPYCLKVIRTRWDAAGITGSAIYTWPGLNGYANAIVPYRIEGRYLLANEQTAAIEYVGRIEDPAQFDELFTDVLAQRLAGEIGMSLTDNASLVKNTWDIYQSKLVEARTIDAQEGTPRDIVDLSPWIVARL